MTQRPLGFKDPSADATPAPIPSQSQAGPASTHLLTQEPQDLEGAEAAAHQQVDRDVRLQRALPDVLHAWNKGRI